MEHEEREKRVAQALAAFDALMKVLPDDDCRDELREAVNHARDQVEALALDWERLDREVSELRGAAENALEGLRAKTTPSERSAVAKRVARVLGRREMD